MIDPFGGLKIGTLEVVEHYGVCYVLDCPKCGGLGLIYENFLDPPSQCECYLQVSEECERLSNERPSSVVMLPGQ